MELVQTYVEAYIDVIKKYAVFEGRARRKEFWTFALCNLIIGVGFGILNIIPFLGMIFRVLCILYSFAVLVPSLAVGARRLHDTNRSGLYLLIGLIPCVGVIILLVLCAQEGTPGENQYGADPKAAA